ncbi:type 1 glycerol-3-phosphate oxidase [Aerococcaceae bacterium WGS1372]
MAGLTFKSRDKVINTLQDEVFDLVIIGGGITGAGLAVQAAASGLKTALIEMQDFSEGTSSRSTKLVHGGLRYLKQFDVEVVEETVQERTVVQGIAPHIPKPDPMLLPIYDEPSQSFSKLELKIAMDLYDRLAGVTDSPYANKLLTREEVLERQPNLMKENLVAGGFYLDYRNNDSRLVIENIKQAHTDGALLLSRAKVTGFEYDEANQIEAVVVEDQLNNKRPAFSIKSQVVINASGPWSDLVRDLDIKVESQHQMRPTKGVHLVVDNAKLSVNSPVYFDSGEGDKRMVFVLPRENKTYFGTTDTDYDGDLTHPKVSQHDVDYLLRIVNRRFPEANLSIGDIEASWAGLRPLISGNSGSDYNGGNNGSISNESFDELAQFFSEYNEGRVPRSEVEKAISDVSKNNQESSNAPSSVSRGSDLSISETGLLTLAGGKITDYRKMAEGAMKVIIDRLKELGHHFELIDSKSYQVSGGHFDPHKVDESITHFAQQYQEAGLSPEDSDYLANLYGSNVDKVLTYLDQAQELASEHQLALKDALSLLYALSEEAVYSSEDFFLRRTNYMLFRSEEMPSLIESVQAIIQDYLGLTDEERTQQYDELVESINEHSLKALKETE